MDLAAARLLLVGCGKMGSALARGWIAAGARADNIVAVEPAPDAAAAFPDGLCPAFVDSPDNAPAGFSPDVIVFAVKPQVMEAVVPAYARYADSDTVFLSIAAGTPIRFFEAHLSSASPIVRSMPNTPAAVGRGVTAAICNANVPPEGRALCEALLGAVGEVVWVTDEAEIDAVTAVSGSGPAYVFHLVETMTAAGIAEGLVAGCRRRAGAGDRRRRRRTVAPVAGRRRHSAPERDQPRRHHRGGTRGADGAGRARRPDEKGDCRGRPTLAGIGGMSDPAAGPGHNAPAVTVSELSASL